MVTAEDAPSEDALPRTSALGRRVIVVGSSCAGKSTLGERLAVVMGVPFVELDALYWKPGWVAPPEEEFRRKVTAATVEDGWVVAGNYHREMSATIWPRAEIVIWLDLPLPLTISRILRRSWTRWRKHELLWGTNEEKFWAQLKLWSSEDSLIAYTLGSWRRSHRRYLDALSDPQWAHIRFVRLRSRAEAERFAKSLEATLAGTDRD